MGTTHPLTQHDIPEDSSLQ